MPDLVETVLDDMKTRINAIPEFRKTALAYYDGDTLLNGIASLKQPSVGVVYEGMSSEGNDEYGKKVRLRFGIYIFATQGTKDADVLSSSEMLKLVRNVFLETCAPNNRKWKFEAEMPVDLTDGIIYMQRWSVTGILNPRIV